MYWCCWGVVAVVWQCSPVPEGKRRRGDRQRRRSTPGGSRCAGARPVPATTRRESARWISDTAQAQALLRRAPVGVHGEFAGGQPSEPGVFGPADAVLHADVGAMPGRPLRNSGQAQISRACDDEINDILCVVRMSTRIAGMLLKGAPAANCGWCTTDPGISLPARFSLTRVTAAGMPYSQRVGGLFVEHLAGTFERGGV
jgi:hypothetical protein